MRPFKRIHAFGAEIKYWYIWNISFDKTKKFKNFGFAKNQRKSELFHKVKFCLEMGRLSYNFTACLRWKERQGKTFTTVQLLKVPGTGILRGTS
jgi:hypothetical protein